MNYSGEPVVSYEGAMGAEDIARLASLLPHKAEPENPSILTEIDAAKRQVKYAVFKIEDWQRTMADMGSPALTLPHPLVKLRDKALMDTIVIRRQDIFAAPALYAYSNAIQVAVKAMKAAGYTGPEVHRLSAIADYFMGEAELATEEGYKTPD